MTDSNEKPEASAPREPECPRCGDLFYDPKTLIAGEKQRAAEWEEEVRTERARAEKAEAQLESTQHEMALIAIDSIMALIKERDAWESELTEAKRVIGELRETLKNADCVIRNHERMLAEKGVIVQSFVDCEFALKASEGWEK